MVLGLFYSSQFWKPSAHSWWQRDNSLWKWSSKSVLSLSLSLLLLELGRDLIRFSYLDKCVSVVSCWVSPSPVIEFLTGSRAAVELRMQEEGYNWINGSKAIINYWPIFTPLVFDTGPVYKKRPVSFHLILYFSCIFPNRVTVETWGSEGPWVSGALDI